MSDYVLPPSIVANAADWTLIDYSGIQQSPLSGAIRTISRGQRWQAHYQWHDLITNDRHALSALMAVVRGKSNRLWISDPTYRQRGSFPAPELLTNGSFEDGATSWAVAGAGTLLGYNRTLTLTTTGTTAPGVSQPVTLAAGAAYALRACLIDGPSSSAVNLGVQLGDGATAVSAIGLARGLVTVARLIATGGVGNQYPILLSGAGITAGMIVLCSYASLRRCALARNPTAATFFTAIAIDALPPSTAGLLRAGDRVEINGEMKTVTFDLNSDATGLGQLMFEPALRKVVPDNSPVIIGEPMMKTVLSVDALQVTRPGMFSDFDFTFVEA